MYLLISCTFKEQLFSYEKISLMHHLFTSYFHKARGFEKDSLISLFVNKKTPVKFYFQ
ncbi:hypothetical protein FM106_09540 [Brachybacterium faecium]|nr:hypothetical protein FM106_09540 [Brachybacterium faecium]